MSHLKFPLVSEFRGVLKFECKSFYTLLLLPRGSSSLFEWIDILLKTLPAPFTYEEFRTRGFSYLSLAVLFLDKSSSLCVLKCSFLYSSSSIESLRPPKLITDRAYSLLFMFFIEISERATSKCVSWF